MNGDIEALVARKCALEKAAKELVVATEGIVGELEKCSLTLRKEPTNQFDNEAIQVLLHDGQPDGYVSNWYKTRRPDTMSAGGLVDKIPDEIEAVIVDLAPVVAEVELPSQSVDIDFNKN